MAIAPDTTWNSATEKLANGPILMNGRTEMSYPAWRPASQPRNLRSPDPELIACCSKPANTPPQRALRMTGGRRNACAPKRRFVALHEIPATLHSFFRSFERLV